MGVINPEKKQVKGNHILLLPGIKKVPKKTQGVFKREQNAKGQNQGIGERGAAVTR